MVNYAKIQQKIDHGNSIAGRILGAPHEQFRVDQNASGDFPTGWTTVGTTAIRKTRITDQKLQSGLKSSGTLFFKVLVQQNFLLGDVCINVDPAVNVGVSYGAGASWMPGTKQFDGVVLAGAQPIQQTVGILVNTRAHIFRSSSLPVVSNGVTRWDATNNDSQALALANGVFSFGNGLPSYVPVGLTSSDRPSRDQEFKANPAVPTTTAMPRYYGYLPPLPGYLPREGDQLIAEDGARYIVYNPYYQDVGIVGAQLALQRTMGDAG